MLRTIVARRVCLLLLWYDPIIHYDYRTTISYSKPKLLTFEFYLKEPTWNSSYKKIYAGSTLKLFKDLPMIKLNDERYESTLYAYYGYF